jgi:hypothetical protein
MDTDTHGFKTQGFIRVHLCESVAEADAVDSDDTLTPEEWELVKKAEREMRQGKFVTLAQLKHELARKRPSRGGKTA